jgi:hypothetical protein
MRKLMIAVAACSIFAAGSVYAAEAQKMDESTNPNTNTDVKTQNLQQKPNSAYDDNTVKPSRHHKAHSKAKAKATDATDDSLNADGTEKLRQKPE